MIDITLHKRTRVLGFAWFISLCLLWAAFFRGVAGGFPDVAPNYTPLFWISITLLSVLQVAYVVTRFADQRITAKRIMILLLVVLLLVPEYFLLFATAVFPPLILPLILLVAIVRAVFYLIRRYRKR
jgi:hypothetical protein